MEFNLCFLLGGEERAEFKDRLIKFLEKFLSVAEIDLDLKQKEVSFIHLLESNFEIIL